MRFTFAEVPLGYYYRNFYSLCSTVELIRLVPFTCIWREKQGRSGEKERFTVGEFDEVTGQIGLVLGFRIYHYQGEDTRFEAVQGKKNGCLAKEMKDHCETENMTKTRVPKAPNHL